MKFDGRGPWWGIVSLEEDLIHYGRLRIEGKFLVVHEDEMTSPCCNEEPVVPSIVVVPLSEVVMLTLFETEDELKREVARNGDFKKKLVHGPEVG